MIQISETIVVISTERVKCPIEHHIFRYLGQYGLIGLMSCPSKALVNVFSHCLASHAPAAKELEHDLPGNVKPLTTYQACWYLNEKILL